MNFDLREIAKEHILVAAHRGVAGGNIPCNTMAAYEIALRQGADILEVDVSCSRDKELFLFHPGMELSHMNLPPFCFPFMNYSFIKKFHYVNYDRVPTQFSVTHFDDFLEAFKGRCLINIDKFPAHPKEICKALKRHGMEGQCIIKSKPEPKILDFVEEVCPHIQYMPVVKNADFPHSELLERNINYVAVETVFADDSCKLVREDFVEKLHKNNILLWGNPIIYNHRDQIAGGHSDDRAMQGDEDGSWGWLVERGFDILQTDWTGPLVDYLKKSGRYLKNKVLSEKNG